MPAASPDARLTMPRRTAIKDYLYESQLFLTRTVVMLTLVVLATVGLIARLYYLQIHSHEHYQTLSQDNRVKLQPVPPTRGLIYDRNGVLLAENLPSYSLELVPEQVPDMNSTLATLSTLVTITTDDLDRFDKLRQRSRRFNSIPLRLRLSDEEVARFAVRRHNFPGVDIQARLNRHYPMGELTSHVLGYVGRINVEELGQINATQYRGSTHIGKVGIEKTYEDLLHGQVGLQRVETNATGRVLRVLERDDPVPGKDLHLNLDIRLQAEAVAALGDFNGAVVVIDPRTGEILAFVSKPGFDPNLFVNGINYKAYRALNKSPDKPLFNRALRGQYPPGSTIKPFYALAGLDYDLSKARQGSYCPGFYRLPNKEHKYRDWKRSGHGHVTLDDAITQSCDVFFYELALALGIDNMHAFMTRFGFGEKTGIDLVGERSGLMPSREWKRRARSLPWFPGETLITGIGQGFSLATPLQLASATATLAERGRRVQPHLLRAVQSTGEPPQTVATSAKGIAVTDIDAAHWQAVIQAMTHVVHGPRGTARRIGKGIDYQIAGKTGTAQVFTIKQDEKYDADTLDRRLHDHALFIAFAPAKAPQIALAVVVENGGSGSAVAAPIARRIIDHYFELQES